MNTKVTLAGVELKNPVMTASGTFGSGAEYGDMVDLNRENIRGFDVREFYVGLVAALRERGY